MGMGKRTLVDAGWIFIKADKRGYPRLWLGNKIGALFNNNRRGIDLLGN